MIGCNIAFIVVLKRQSLVLSWYCKANSTWYLQLTDNANSGGAVTYEAAYSDETNCSPLTASFKLIGK